MLLESKNDGFNEKGYRLFPSQRGSQTEYTNLIERPRITPSKFQYKLKIEKVWELFSQKGIKVSKE